MIDIEVLTVSWLFGILFLHVFKAHEPLVKRLVGIAGFGCMSAGLAIITPLVPDSPTVWIILGMSVPYLVEWSMKHAGGWLEQYIARAVGQTYVKNLEPTAVNVVKQLLGGKGSNNEEETG